MKDKGIGIPEADLDHIFERFYRVEGAKARHVGGTGLGLAIVRHVVGNHKGEVRVESEEGEGSTFVLRLPAGPPASGAGRLEGGLTQPRRTGPATYDGRRGPPHHGRRLAAAPEAGAARRFRRARASRAFSRLAVVHILAVAGDTLVTHGPGRVAVLLDRAGRGP